MRAAGAVEAFREGGWTMFWVFWLALLAHAAVLVAVVLARVRTPRGARRIAGGVALALGVATLVVGVFGWRYGVTMVDRALEGVDPAMHAELRAQGEKEAGRNLTFGLYACALPIVAGGALLGLRARRRA
jgi:hypothetical protein